MFRRSLSLRVLAALLVAFMLSALPTPGSAQAATCAAYTYTGHSYCATSISQIKAGAYPLSTRVVLRGVSVMASTTSTVTVASVVATACPPDRYCGSLITIQTLTVAWRGPARPAVQTAIDLYGVTTVGSMKPYGYVYDLDGCYIDFC
jgi:hypothetical protein